VSLSSGDEVPHIFTRKSRLQPGEFLITSAKRLLQQYLPIPDVSGCSKTCCEQASYSKTVPRRVAQAASASVAANLGRRGVKVTRFDNRHRDSQP
jgi:hypothetical protein